MSGPELLGGGAEQRLGRRGRRLWTVGVTALVAAVTVVLAARSNPEPPAAAPTPTPDAPVSATPTAPVPLLLTGAVGSRWAYALLATCAAPEELRDCTTQLHRRSLAGGGWAPVAWRTGRTSGTAAQLHVTPDDQVTVLGEPTAGPVYVSTDGGRTARMHRLQPGPPVAGIPAGGVLAPGLCEECSSRLTVLDPATGRLRPLATQPSFGRTAGIRSMVDSGEAVWVLAESGEAGADVVAAVSADRGRTWRARPIPGTGRQWAAMQIFPDGGAGAYALLGADDQPDLLNEFTELWHIDGPTDAWRRITPAGRPKSALTLIPGGRGLLIATEDGEAWRLRADGTLRRLLRAEPGGASIAPGVVVSGPGGAFLGLAQVESDLRRPTVVISFDEGETWRSEQIG